ncbi:hypothetical protein ACHAXS_008457 [Conticribra weissflogii]
MKLSPAAVETAVLPSPILRRSTRKAALEANAKILTPKRGNTLRASRSAHATPTRNKSGSSKRLQDRDDDSAENCAGSIDLRTPPARRLFDETYGATKSSPAAIDADAPSPSNLHRSKRRTAREVIERARSPRRDATPARNAIARPARRLSGGPHSAETTNLPRLSSGRSGTPRPARTGSFATQPDRPAAAPRSPSAPSRTPRRVFSAVKPEFPAVDERKPLGNTAVLRRSSGLKDDGNLPQFRYARGYSKRLKRLVAQWKYNWGAKKRSFFENGGDVMVMMFHRRYDGKVLEVRLACTVERGWIHGRLLSRKTYHPQRHSFTFGAYII